jgi:thioredoxin reductase
MLVVGGGDSAIESALGLANQAGTTVTLSYRGAEFGRVKERNREKIDAAVDAGRVELLLESQVKEIRRDVVVLEHQGALRLLPNDGVVVRIGGEAPYPFLERIGVKIVKKELVLEPEGKAELG